MSWPLSPRLTGPTPSGVPVNNISGEVEIPSSKSYTNRALIIASLVKGEVKIINPLISDDTRAMISCLKELSIKNFEVENKFLKFIKICRV